MLHHAINGLIDNMLCVYRVECWLWSLMPIKEHMLLINKRQTDKYGSLPHSGQYNAVYVWYIHSTDLSSLSLCHICEQMAAVTKWCNCEHNFMLFLTSLVSLTTVCLQNALSVQHILFFLVCISVSVFMCVCINVCLNSACDVHNYCMKWIKY